MPRIPTYDGPQVQEQAAPNLRVSVDAPVEAFGGGAGLNAVGQAASGVLKQVREFAIEQYDLANKTRINEERSEFNKWETEKLYGENGFLRRQGKNAFGIPEEAKKAWDEFIAEREKGLSNADQRLAFKELSTARWAAMSRRLTEHVALQTQVYEKDVYDASLETSKERGSTDVRYAPQEAAYIRQQVALRGKSLGWDDKKIEQEMRDHTSDLFARTAANLLVNQQDLAAEKFFLAVKDQMDPDVARKVQEWVQAGSLVRRAQEESDRILAKSTTLTQAMSMVREIEDPKLRDETQKRVEHSFSVRRAEKRDNEERMYLTATNMVEKDKSVDRLMRTPLWNNLPLSHRTALRSYAEALASGRKIETDPAVYYELERMATTPQTKDKFLEENLLQYIDKLSREHLFKFMDLQGALRKQDPKAELELDGIRTNREVVNDVLRAAGIDPTPDDKNKKAGQLANAAREAIDQAVAAESQRLGRKLTREELSKIASDMVVKGITSRGRLPWGLSDTTKRRFELLPDEPFAVDDIADVPRIKRLEIEAYLRRRGRPVTDAAILELYNAEIAGGRARGGR
jgi:hypothetical protein